MTNHESISSLQPLRWLFLDLNSYFASVEQQENPHLRGKPVGIVPMMVDSTCCLAASYEAKAFGVQTGTLVSDARHMCPGIQFVEARHDMYVKYHHAIIDAVESCMHVDVVLSIDEMAGRLYGREKDVDEAVKLAQKIKQTITTRVGAYLKSSIGIAPNKFLAKVAGEMKKPDGLTVIQGHELPYKLFSLKLRDLSGIGKNMERRLNRFGITTMKELCTLDDKTMHEIWGGIGGDRFAAGLRGEEIELPPSQHRSLGHSHVLEPELRTKDGAYRVAKRLVSKAALRLRKMGYWAGGMHIGVSLSQGGSWSRKIKLTDTQDTPTFLTVLNQLWEDFPESRPVWVGITLFPLIPPNHHTISLFDGDKRERLAQVMDAINEKHGKNTLYVADLFDVTKKTAPTRIPFSRVPDLSEFK